MIVKRKSNLSYSLIESNNNMETILFVECRSNVNDIGQMALRRRWLKENIVYNFCHRKRIPILQATN